MNIKILGNCGTASIKHEGMLQTEWHV